MDESDSMRKFYTGKHKMVVRFQLLKGYNCLIDLSVVWIGLYYSIVVCTQCNFAVKVQQSASKMLGTNMHGSQMWYEIQISMKQVNFCCVTFFVLSFSRIYILLSMHLDIQTVSLVVNLLTPQP